MKDVQVVLNGNGLDVRLLSASIETLLRAVRRVELAHVEPATMTSLHGRFGARVKAADHIRPGVPLLVSPGEVAFSSGAVRRIARHTNVPRRCVTRVFLPGVDDDQYPSCWSSAWLGAYQGSLASLVDADLSFDRRHLPARSAQARSWLTAEGVGVALMKAEAEAPTVWARRTGWSLDAQHLFARLVRGPAGGVRRRAARRRHRRRAAAVAGAGR
ncbi:MAG: hypothetical protein WA892_09890 [Ornithinimicrobium sp.]